MGFVKFGQLTLNVEQVPDGHVVISETEYTNLKSANNAYLGLKSRLPVGLDETQLSGIIDKGNRFDATAQQLKESQDSLNQVKGQLDQFSKIPKDFSTERWNKYVKDEQMRVRESARQKLTSEILDEVSKELGVKITVDDRFIPAEQLQNFDFSQSDAKEKWKGVLDAAHTEQENFVKTTFQSVMPTPQTPGQGSQQPQPRDRRLPGSNDAVGDQAVKVGRL